MTAAAPVMRTSDANRKGTLIAAAIAGIHPCRRMLSLTDVIGERSTATHKAPYAARATNGIQAVTANIGIGAKTYNKPSNSFTILSGIEMTTGSVYKESTTADSSAYRVRYMPTANTASQNSVTAPATIRPCRAN